VIALEVTAMERYPDKLSYEFLIRILERRLTVRRPVAEQKYFAELLIDLRLRDQELKSQYEQRGDGQSRAA
jgi:hypothetical protein